MDDRDIRELSDIFHGTLSLDDPSKEDESKRSLRLDSSHYRLDPKQESIAPPKPASPPPTASTNTTTTTTTVPTTTTLTTATVSTTQLTQAAANISTMATPIKILPTTASVRSYSGAETDYSAREFIEQCESVMRNASVTEPGVKIAFVESNLQPGSMACKLMQSSMF